MATPDTPRDGTIRAYDQERDLASVQRIWRETGWATEDRDAAFVEPFHRAGRTMVYELDGVAESSVHITPGRIRFQQDDLRLAAVTAVTTSHVARRRGIAGRMLAGMLAEDAERGAHVAALGMFEQGFYDRLGFGTGPYEHLFSFDPARLAVEDTPGPPLRVTADDWRDVHACLLRRMRSHGGVCLDDADIVRAELSWNEPSFGLGYRDGDGELTHFVFGRARGEHGPYEVNWLAYRDIDQLRELLALLRSLGDQVHEIKLVEPPELQLQDLLQVPFRDARRTRGELFQRSVAWWQLRVLDPVSCVAALELPGEELTFNLELHDPITTYLPDDSSWPGLSGDYVVTLGPASSCERGASSTLPTLRAGVAAFSRLLFGVRPASVLAATTDLAADDDLLAALDRAVRLPPPHLAWDL